jgi:hypothetical protein
MAFSLIGYGLTVTSALAAEPSARIELATPSLPRKCTTTVLRGRILICGRRLGAGDGTRTHDNQLGRLELYQLSYTRGGVLGQSCGLCFVHVRVVEGEGFEPSKAVAGRFTVCSLWPLGNPSSMSSVSVSSVARLLVVVVEVELAVGLEPATS